MQQTMQEMKVIKFKHRKEGVRKEKECFTSGTPGLVEKGLGVGLGRCCEGLGFRGKEVWVWGGIN